MFVSLSVEMDRSRLGNLHGNNNSAPPKKRLKPLFANHQQHGRLVKDNIDGTTTEFNYNNFFDEEEVHTAIVGDSIFDSICVKYCVAYSLSGGGGGKLISFLCCWIPWENTGLIQCHQKFGEPSKSDRVHCTEEKLHSL